MTRYEAESATLSAGGTVDADHAGHSGTGFANATNAVGSYGEWTVTAAAAGAASLSFGYANATAATRPVDLSVNGQVVASGVTFPATGAWTTWSALTRTASLTAGANTVRVTATTADGPANLDYLDVSAP
ncbi:carbohydrate-binding protein [Amycolatopsis sp. H20-H5]|uniref:carbohydrate-binding protein n=1 Tax=Amycolatopsis sp. H20-H5 TaxID=3046309 RepID=UPI002DBA31D4|nr:carbohydrate-binding protein [Amycolatopsis sp. H20-H5]MEC3978461.1 carbohydrate-binding protein [Amycolatopsis sp. H20-H5]